MTMVYMHTIIATIVHEHILLMQTPLHPAGMSGMQPKAQKGTKNTMKPNHQGFGTSVGAACQACLCSGRFGACLLELHVRLAYVLKVL